jgi:hypothetical protein
MRLSVKSRIPPTVATKIGYYVYLLIDPRNRRTFYVGKGRGARAAIHLEAKGKSPVAQTIRGIRRAGRQPQIDILAHGLLDAETAFRVEAAVIDSLGLDQLVNRVRGWHASQLGRMSLRRLLAYYHPNEANVRDKVILVRINRLYRHDMSKRALYEATRGVWKLNPDRAGNAKYALATFQGIVYEVYEIVGKWVPAGTARYLTRSKSEVVCPGRWEFKGRLAPMAIRKRYLDRSVRKHLPPGLQAPVVYVNC